MLDIILRVIHLMLGLQVAQGKIKRICETELGIVSQCCKPHILQRLSKQYFENVALKINVKVCYIAT